MTEDFIIFDQNSIRCDMFLSWEMNDAGCLKGTYEGLYTYTNHYVMDGKLMMRYYRPSTGTNEKLEIKCVRIGNVFMSKGTYSRHYVHGKREDLMKVAAIFDELRDSGDFDEIVKTCCEVAAL